MEWLREDGFRKLLKSGLSGGYLFFGEEDYLKAFSVRSARDVICADPSFALFNEMKLEALDYTPSALLDALMPMPMMSEQKLVILNGLCPGSMKPSELEELCEVLSALPEYDYNVLIMVVPAGGMDEGNLPKRPSATLQKLAEHLKPVRFEAVTPARLHAWVGKHFAHHGVQASPELCAYLVRYCGTSMYTLASEIDKLCFYVLQNGRSTVSEQDVLHVAIPHINNDAFALANALVDGKYDQALAALSVMKFRRVEPVIILSEVSRVLCDLLCVKALLSEGKSVPEIASVLKMNEYKLKLYVSSASAKSLAKLKRAVSLCRDADLAIKLSPQGYLAIENLICAL